MREGILDSIRRALYAFTHLHGAPFKQLEQLSVPRGTHGSREAVPFDVYLMNCRDFRREHDAYIDDLLSGLEMEAMARHRESCARCARLDTCVRRALLLAHNLPTIQPSSGFAERLQLRLMQERAIIAAGRVGTGSERWYSLSVATYSAIAAGLLTVAVLGAGLTAITHERQTIRLAPVVASLPESEPSTLATPALVASLPAAMGVWPAVYVAQQAPWHFAEDAAER